MTKSRARSTRLLVSSRLAAGRFAAVLRRPGATEFFLSAALARLGIAMTGLGLLLSIRHATGSYAVAGAATAVFAGMEAVVGPQLARLVDRWGQAVVVTPSVLVHGAAVAGAIALAGRAPTALVMCAVAVAGAAAPQPGALSAARWSGIMHGAELRTAFSLEALTNDVVFLAGPIAVVAASTLITWWAGSATAAAAVTIGCLALASQRRTAPPAGRSSARSPGDGAGRLFTAAFARVLGVNLALGCFFGAAPLIVTAATQAAGVPGVSGAVLALSSAASMVCGVAYGARRGGARPELVQLRAAVALGAGVLIGTVWPQLPGVALMLVLCGAAIAPLVATSTQLTQATVSPARLTQGFTWINTASAAGISGSSALTGLLLSEFGSGAIATGALVGAVVLAVGCAGLSVHRGRVS